MSKSFIFKVKSFLDIWRLFTGHTAFYKRGGLLNWSWIDRSPKHFSVRVGLLLLAFQLMAVSTKKQTSLFWKNWRESVWPDIWPLTAKTFAKLHVNFTKLGKKFCPNTKRPLKFAKVFQNFAKVAKFRQIWSHWREWLLMAEYKTKLFTLNDYWKQQ